MVSLIEYPIIVSSDATIIKSTGKLNIANKARMIKTSWHNIKIPLIA